MKIIMGFMTALVLVIYGSILVFVPFATYVRVLSLNAPQWLACTVATAVLIVVGFITFPKEILFPTKLDPEALAKFRRL